MRQLRLGMHRRVRRGESAAGKLPRQGSKPLPVGTVKRGGVCHQNGLVILRSPRKQGRDERNPEAPALVAEQIGQARSLVVFILGQIGVRKLTHGNKERSDPQPLDSARNRYMPVIRSQIKAGEVPHRERKNDVPRENHRLDANFRENPDHQRR